MRKHYLDNIRWMTVVLVLIYHVFYMFNAAGVLGGVGSFSETQWQDALLYFVYPWFMVLLFVVSGMSAKLALDKRTDKEFIRSRTVKLLVPSTLGLFAFQWIVGYFNLTASGAADTIPAFLRYPVMVLSGIGPLWFIQLLWLFSLLLVLLRRIDPAGRLYALGGKCNTAALLLLFVPMWGAAQILNAPVITTYRFGIYLLAFLLGYYVFSHDAVMDRVERLHVPLLIAAVVAGVAYTWYYFGTNYASDACLKHIFTAVYLWLAVLAVLGCGKAWFDRTSAFSAYMASASFGIYIVHYAVVISTCYLLKSRTALTAAVVYPVAIVAVCALSPALYELLRRIPLLRYLVLGIKKEWTNERAMIKRAPEN